jgi:hypothetical protein
MSTLDDVVADAKATGEFEGSVEDIRATRVTLKGAPEVIATDQSCGAITTFTCLVIDRGISFDSVVQSIIDANERGPRKSDDDDKVEEKGNEEGNEDEEDEEEEDDLQCKSGFYISRRKIAGRFLVMFAQRKVEKEVGIDSDFIDPLNLMVISRPNTGKNPIEMPSQEMRFKYKLLASSADMLDSIDDTVLSDTDEKDGIKCDETQPSTNGVLRIIRDKWSNIADLWDDAYDNSNFTDFHEGLAPRISEIALITGAVLHILPSLEKAVQFMPVSQRSLRVIRVELSDTGEKIVGSVQKFVTYFYSFVSLLLNQLHSLSFHYSLFSTFNRIKFPVSDEAIVRLLAGMKEVANARQSSSNSPSFVDEPFSPVNEKSRTWATSERKTMKSFFGAATSKAVINRSNTSAITTGDDDLQSGKRKSVVSLSPPMTLGGAKKQKSITSTTNAPSKKSTAASNNISSFFRTPSAK